MSDWEKDNEAFLIKIGQVELPSTKPTPIKKEEE